MQAQSQNKPHYFKHLISHLNTAKYELESVLNFCNDLDSENINLTSNEISLIRYTLDARIDQGIRCNLKLASDKIDLSPLMDLKSKFDRLDNNQDNFEELSF